MIILICLLAAALVLLMLALFFALMSCAAMSGERYAIAFAFAWVSLGLVCLALGLVLVLWGLKYFWSPPSRWCGSWSWGERVRSWTALQTGSRGRLRAYVWALGASRLSLAWPLAPLWRCFRDRHP